jgi:hypothetical protein
MSTGAKLRIGFVHPDLGIGRAISKENGRAD